jgi:hypothetical protein
MKVKFFDKDVRNIFWKYFSVISGIVSFMLLFNLIPEFYKECLIYFGYLSFVVLIVLYVTIWLKANSLVQINIEIDGTTVNIKRGDLFSEVGLKAISFNEYFDTIVDDRIISGKSLNGIFVNRYFKDKIAELDDYIDANSENEDLISNQNVRKHGGKTKKFKLSTIIVYNDFLLTAFSKFDEHDRAILTMPEYIEFLINFWDRVNRIYAQKSVSVPIFGSGITRIKEHKNIGDEDLLKIMLWTFKLSEMKFKYPAKLTIVLHKDKIGQINLFNLKSFGQGF